MGRKQSHKKDIKAEKAKVKLKQSKTKFLPKGQNVTNTTFKVKSIVIPEQLKEKGSEEILSKRKLNVKDLLTRMKHYNENVKQSACEELSDIIKLYTEEIVQQYLSQVCLAVSSLMQDKEHKVRKAAAKSVGVILQYVPNEKLRPFFNYFATNLRCAMTNIDKNIQEDSLLFLDCFIQSDGELIKKSAEKLLPDFFSLISKLRSDSDLGRTLTLNLGSKHTSIAWRIKVLSRLHAVLQIILGENHDSDTQERLVSEMVYDSNTARLPLYKDTFGAVLDLQGTDIFVGTKLISTDPGSDIINKHIVTLVPLLYETWLEVLPEQKVKKSDSESFVLNDEVAALLSCIMNTLYLLWKYVKKFGNEQINLKTVFLSPDGQKFLNHLLNNFPYCQTGGRVKKGHTLKILEQNSDPKCSQENLLICFLYLTLHVGHTNKNLRKEMKTIGEYLSKVIKQKNQLKENGLQCLLELFAECLGGNYRKWLTSGVDLKFMLENIVALYNSNKINSETVKLSVFRSLSGIVNNKHLNGNINYHNWLSSLPNLLCQSSVSDITIQVLLDLSKKNSTVFNDALIKKLPDILDNLPQVQIVLHNPETILNNLDTVRRNWANIFYFVLVSSEKDLDPIRDFIEVTDTSFGEYFKEVLSLRAEMNKGHRI